MHRHGYKQRKLQLEAGPRRALVRGQLTSLILHEQITTTEAKAREIAPQFERLVTKAKKGDLHNRRQIRSVLLTDRATAKLVEAIAPAFAGRSGGYTRVVKLGNRRGDNAAMATVILTDKPQAPSAGPAKPSAQDAAQPEATKPQPDAKQPAGRPARGRKTAASKEVAA